jgi:hypothetical protein
VPAATRWGVEAITGPIRRSESVVAGFSSNLAEILETATGQVFVKGMHTDDPEVWSQRREAVLARYVAPIGPRLRWHFVDDGWDLLGFDYVPGTFADYRIDSDLAATAATMTALGALRCPPRSELKDAVARWGAYLPDPADRRLLAGDALLHTDWNYSNVIVTASGTARLVDWPWATRGAAWIDPGCWIVWLILAGRAPAEAERWAAHVPCWLTATARELTVFSTALAAEWSATAARRPNVWTQSLRDAACQWARYRLDDSRVG